MASGYSIFWTDHALEELTLTLGYLEDHFDTKVLNKLAKALDNTLYLLRQNPGIFPISDRVNIRRTVVAKYNTLYYRVKGDRVEILSFFSNRQSPDSRKI